MRYQCWITLVYCYSDCSIYPLSSGGTSDGNNNRAAERSANCLWTRDFEKKHQHQSDESSIAWLDRIQLGAVDPWQINAAINIMRPDEPTTIAESVRLGPLGMPILSTYGEGQPNAYITREIMKELLFLMPTNIHINNVVQYIVLISTIVLLIV
eukprot:CAMPEP_0116015628 /NCGR_PEP_ID=MMETSP0321-20121206/6962_1 /TAXON_ID=163516 /ORGANISM="Leptocylindrus danicus var. danicus, Strain B650" /LENGTH=153 /DNA_ID=CAMNT_0003485459 /DNA_START=184 /DNA_END=645 /DNA_ORIENTATION=+